MKNKIKHYRELRGLSQDELAETAGISRTSLSNLESGKTVTTTNTTMLKISEALEVGVVELFYSQTVQ